MANALPNCGVIVEAGQWGEPKLPAKAERVYGKPSTLLQRREEHSKKSTWDASGDPFCEQKSHLGEK